MRSASYNEIQIGHRFTPDVFVLRRNDIERYKRIVAGPNSQSGTDPTPGGLVAPPTMAAVHLFRSYYAAYPPSPGRLHASVEFSFIHPWSEDATITVTGVITDKYIKRDRKYVRFELTFTDEKGQQLTKAIVDEITME